MENKGYKFDFSKFVGENYASEIMCQQNDNLTSPTQQTANQSYPVQEYPVQGVNIAPMPNRNILCREQTLRLCQINIS